MNRKLTKSKSNIVISGSLAGVAEFLGIDPTIVRVIYFIVSLFTAGLGFLLYIGLMVLLPSGQTQQGNGYREPYSHPYMGNKTSQNKRPRKEAEKVEEEDWSDF